MGDAADIHPKDKQDVGSRLALAARKVAYGDKAVVYSGPVYEKMTVKDGAVHLTFKNPGNGLVIGYAPWVTLLRDDSAYLRAAPASAFWALMPHYVGQYTESACSLATAVMVANAVRGRLADQAIALRPGQA